MSDAKFKRFMRKTLRPVRIPPEVPTPRDWPLAITPAEWAQLGRDRQYILNRAVEQVASLWLTGSAKNL